jgi:glycosyltransferase involved in cell wall biosynthesis
MNILIVSDYFQPIIGYAKVQVARSLLRQGHTVKIVTSDRYFPFHNYQDTAQKLLGRRIQKSGDRKEQGFTVERKKTVIELFARVYFRGIDATLHRFKPDVVIVFGMSSPSAIQVARLKKQYNNFKFVCVDSHLPSELLLGNVFIKKLFYGLFRLFFAQLLNQTIDTAIAQQDKTVEVIRDWYGIKNKIAIVPNGTDTNKFIFSVSERKKIRQEYNVPLSAFVIIYTGKCIKQKGLDLLFKAFAVFAEKHIDAWLLVVGNGSEEYVQYCTELLSPTTLHRYIAVDFQEEDLLYKYYSAADVAIWPLQESLAMNDAAACELPFIANNTMGDTTRISNKNALLYKRASVRDLVSKMEYLYLHPTERKAMGKRGRKLMVKKLSWDTIARDYIS